jgi:hypothetical protein
MTLSCHGHNRLMPCGLRRQMISARAPPCNDRIKLLSIYRTGLTLPRIPTYLLDMSSIITARMAFLERALLAVTNHCVADILCSR